MHKTKEWFVGSADLQPLTVRNKVDLTVASSKNTIQEELKQRGAVTSRATCTVVVVIEKGQVKGHRRPGPGLDHQRQVRIDQEGGGFH